jgi:hypothetical protein
MRDTDRGANRQASPLRRHRRIRALQDGFRPQELRRDKATLGEKGPAMFVCLQQERRPLFAKLRLSPSRASCRREPRPAPSDLRGRLRVR